jgi:hypothetical protein
MKIRQDVGDLAMQLHHQQRLLKRRKSGDEMANNKLFQTGGPVKKMFIKKAFIKEVDPPHGVDHRVYAGVRAGLAAMKARQISDIKKGSNTFCLSPTRTSQRIFVMPATLDDAQAAMACVALNGVVCVDGRDYSISGNSLNWTSDRTLYTSDAIAVRYPLVADADADVTVSEGGMNISAEPVVTLEAVSKLVGDLEEKLTVRTAELAMALESIDTDLKAATFAAEAEIEELEAEEVVDEPEEVIEEPEEEEDMIAPGMKVYHRLTGEGPWIVVQPTVLNIASRQEHAEGNVLKSSFVECAWTVQTDEGIMDYPEVVLTICAPKKKKFWTWKKVTAAIFGASTLVAGIVHAPVILQFFGLIH